MPSQPPFNYSSNAHNQAETKSKAFLSSSFRTRVFSLNQKKSRPSAIRGDIQRTSTSLPHSSGCPRDIIHRAWMHAPRYNAPKATLKKDWEKKKHSFIKYGEYLPIQMNSFCGLLPVWCYQSSVFIPCAPAFLAPNVNIHNAWPCHY